MEKGSFYETGFSFGQKCVFALVAVLACDWKAAHVLYIRSIEGQIMSVFLLQHHSAVLLKLWLVVWLCK